ncbi:Fe-S cluster assembly protein SufD [Sebaldella sp. S0638]|uniref:Fe-S cluster assembly protein SufD n=1 Tax=Sebaldella sp. S0638 TaxID=2957809 RepID=UPI00209DBF24|nr:Fe-S cluster assembly protein SufD [Sebaldella sp. S0638]MCP1224096.1 Fe-S cluster assembly protein SufD [Sebaldella sp. S0638]
MFNEDNIKELDNYQFRIDNFKKYSALSAPKWKRISHNVEVPENYKKFDGVSVSNAEQDGLTVKNINEAFQDMGKYNNDNEYGLNEFFNTQVYSFYNSGKFIHIGERKKLENTVCINYNFNKENNLLIDYNVIVAEDFSEGTIIINYNSEDDTEAYHNGMIKIIAKPNSKIKVIKIQNLNLNSYNFEGSKAEVFGSADVAIYSMEMGAKVNAVSNKNYLEEDGSKIEIWPGYLADKDRKVDLEYSVIFRGRDTAGVIEGRGAVKDTARKVFRGNLYFKKGARHSVGKEGEFAILLDKGVRSDSIPGLFCDEDDVIGEHSASIGKVDESKLFYLMSRGLTENNAKKLIIESSFKPILNSIDDLEMKNKLLEELEKRI